MIARLTSALALMLTAGLATSPALAQTQAAAQDPIAPGTIQATFQGAAAAGCRMDTPLADTVQNAALENATPSSADITITRMVDDDGAVLGSTIILVLPVVCNQAHTLSLSSARGGLSSDIAAPDGGPFRSSVPYAVRLDWAGGSQTFDSDSGDATFPVGDAAQGGLGVTIEIPAGGAPLTAGAYSDELVLQLSAAG